MGFNTSFGSRPKKDSTKYKYEQVTVRMRWIDYCRIKKAFPALKFESASSYFQRLGLWLKNQPKMWGKLEK